MTIESKIRLIAGTFILLSVGLGWFVNPLFFLFTAFVGANLLQSSLTGLCPMESFLCVLESRGQGGGAAD
jgi:hypothetical protein